MIKHTFSTYSCRNFNKRLDSAGNGGYISRSGGCGPELDFAETALKEAFTNTVAVPDVVDVDATRQNN